ncbi:MAG: DNA-binding protein [Bacteroidetes bacterium]|nr:DNA-binding protein [Bacteroidota bacterium]
MTIRYKTEKKRNGINDKESYYARRIGGEIVSTREIAERLADRSTLSQADIRATLIGLSELIETYLHEGRAVKLEDIGVFSLSITSEGYASPEECTPHRVKAKRICFRADPQLKKNLKKVKFERVKK